MILEAAERRFRQGGQTAVRVQVIARDVGLTDAAVHHHFSNRKGLLTALLRHAGRGVREQVEMAALNWSKGARDLASLTELISDCYDRRGYAQLAMWLRLSGVTGRGSGMLSGLVDALQRDSEIKAQEMRLTPLSRTELQFIVALFHMVQAANPLLGEAMLRSAGLQNDAHSRDQFQAWLVAVFERLLQPKRLGDHALAHEHSHSSERRVDPTVGPRTRARQSPPLTSTRRRERQRARSAR